MKALLQTRSGSLSPFFKWRGWRLIGGGGLCRRGLTEADSIAHVYQRLLTRRYLTSKITPLLAMLAVMLCTAMVLVVWSVMGGFLTMLLGTGRTLLGDATINRPVNGIPHYELLMEMLEEDPAIESATGIIDAPGLLKLPDGSILTVQVTGIEPGGFDRVTDFADTLWWRPIDEPLAKDTQRADPRLGLDPQHLAFGERMSEPDEITGEERPAIITGIELARYSMREAGGWYTPQWLFFPNAEATLSVLPLSNEGVAIDVEAQTFPIANEFRTGFYEFDANKVFVPLATLQEMLSMNAAARVDDDYTFGVTTGPDGKATFADPVERGVDPARVTSVVVRASEGRTPGDARDAASAVYERFYNEKKDDPVAAPPMKFVRVMTWEERPGVKTLVAAVKKETALVLALFMFISLTAVFLVFSIFWAMVSEKTKDIGILRAIGASRAGVAWLFLRYGMTIGVIGAALGGAVALLIVTNINPIHEWLGTALGVYVWDPSVYYFTEIPSEVEPAKAALVLGGGVIFSVIGALAPAIKASRMDPVRALRFE